MCETWKIGRQGFVLANRIRKLLKVYIICEIVVFPSFTTDHCGGCSSLKEKYFHQFAAQNISTSVLMSFISVAVGVQTNRNIFLNLWKNQSQTSILLRNKLTSKIITSPMSSCIFCKIVSKTAEANILHEVKNYTKR